MSVEDLYVHILLTSKKYLGKHNFRMLEKKLKTKYGNSIFDDYRKRFSKQSAKENFVNLMIKARKEYKDMGYIDEEEYLTNYAKNVIYSNFGMHLASTIPLSIQGSKVESGLGFSEHNYDTIGKRKYNVDVSSILPRINIDGTLNLIYILSFFILFVSSLILKNYNLFWFFNNRDVFLLHACFFHTFQGEIFSSSYTIICCVHLYFNC